MPRHDLLTCATVAFASVIWTSKGFPADNDGSEDANAGASGTTLEDLIRGLNCRFDDLDTIADSDVVWDGKDPKKYADGFKLKA